MRKRFLWLLTAAVMLFAFGCANISAQSDGKISVIATNFPLYDLARAVAGESANVSMLMPPGAESHTFEPTPKDIIAVREADVFLYIGGHGDEWARDILSANAQTQELAARLMDVIPSEKREQTQDDEHIWTSPKNALLMLDEVERALREADPNNAEAYNKNALAYRAEIEQIDKELAALISENADKKVIFADKFPFRYLALDYGLKYDSAYESCEAEAEPSGAKIAGLIDEMRTEKIPYVFTIEFSTKKIANTIAAETGAQQTEMNSAHNISKEDFLSGVTYAQIMRQNLKNLTEALNAYS